MQVGERRLVEGRLGADAAQRAQRGSPGGRCTCPGTTRQRYRRARRQTSECHFLPFLNTDEALGRVARRRPGVCERGAIAPDFATGALPPRSIMTYPTRTRVHVMHGESLVDAVLGPTVSDNPVRNCASGPIISGSGMNLGED